MSEHSIEKFRIEDGTGSALIDPTHVQAQLRDSLVQGHSSESPSQHRTLLKRHGYTMVDEYGELRSLAYREIVIVPDGGICALGGVVRQADPSGTASYREQPQQNVIGGERGAPLLLSEF